MGTGTDEVAFWGNLLSAAAHGGFALYLLLSAGQRGSGRSAGWLLMSALMLTAIWALSSAAAQYFEQDFWVGGAAAADLARYALWFAFLLRLLRVDTNSGSATVPDSRLDPRSLKAGRLLSYGALVALAGHALLLLQEGATALPNQASRALLISALALPVVGMLAVEQLFRNIGEDARWGAKPLCLGLACIFAYDIYLFSEGLLFTRMDADALALRATVHALAVPFLWIAARRRSDWIQHLQVSRTAAFYSATLVLAGVYLLFMSAVGYYIRYFGGSWGRALQLSLLAVAFALLATLLFSGALRAWIKVFVGKHFFTYRFDYREEWLRFTAMLSSRRSPQETGSMIVRGLARMVECPAGSLWTRVSANAPYTEAASWNVPYTNGAELPDSAFCGLLRDKGWVIDLEEYRTSPRRYGEMVMPTWLLASQSPWLVVPLQVDEELLGFVVLSRPRAPVGLNWEVLDLLKTAGRQAAGYLAQMQATEALLEARKFEAFNRMSAFVVHDLKNIVTQLSLMLKNAERLRDNQEFQQDMLLTVESSLEKMRRLMLQLREGATPVGTARGVELQPLVKRLQALATAQDRRLEVEELEDLSTRGHEDRLERVLGHLVQNALDATPATGRVWIGVERYSGQIRVEVGDTGAGMTEEFVQSRLFRPFNTTKHSGMGIGTYESYQYVRELGGDIQVKSLVGKGTVVSVCLPLLQTQADTGLLRESQR